MLAQTRAGRELDGAELERQLGARGLMSRILRPISARVSESWHMYPVGMLLGELYPDGESLIVDS